MSGGGYIPIPLSLDRAVPATVADGGMSSGGMHVVVNNPMPKSAAQRGKVAVETMATPPGSSSTAAGSGSWSVNARGEMVQESPSGSGSQMQNPISPQQQQHGDSLRWKSKWNKETGTASVIGFPPPPRPAPAQSSIHQTMAFGSRIRGA